LRENDRKSPRPGGRKSSGADERNHAKTLAAQVRSLVADYPDTIRLASDRVLFLNRIERLAALIVFWGVRMNLTAEPGNPGELAFHIIDSVIPLISADGEEFLRPAFRAGSQVLDLGSGAGFPALVLASASRANFTLIESRRKRSSFLAVAAAEMNLKNVVVESRRVEQNRANSGRSGKSTGASVGQFDVVTARAFALPSTLHSLAGSALKSGGIGMLYANPGQNLALPDAVKNGLHEFRLVPYRIPRGDRVVERILGLWRRR
jgi:16S rRNA (guanine(527)-N(7))-methyltransferase RsmG